MSVLLSCGVGSTPQHLYDMIILYFSEYDDYSVDSEERIIYNRKILKTLTRGFPPLYFQCNDKKYKFLSVRQTLHTIEKIFVPNDLPFVTRRHAKKAFDIVLIKLGRLHCSTAEMIKTLICLERDVNDCQTEEAEKCWEITPAVMAGQETVLNSQSFLRALGWFFTIYYYHYLRFT